MSPAIVRARKLTVDGSWPSLKLLVEVQASLTRAVTPFEIAACDTQGRPCAVP